MECYKIDHWHIYPYIRISVYPRMVDDEKHTTVRVRLPDRNIRSIRSIQTNDMNDAGDILQKLVDMTRDSDFPLRAHRTTLIKNEEDLTCDYYVHIDMNHVLIMNMRNIFHTVSDVSIIIRRQTDWLDFIDLLDAHESIDKIFTTHRETQVPITSVYFSCTVEDINSFTYIQRIVDSIIPRVETNELVVKIDDFDDVSMAMVKQLGAYVNVVVMLTTSSTGHEIPECLELIREDSHLYSYSSYSLCMIQ